MSEHDTDIMIVGAGMAGNLVAHRLAMSGRSVTVLEAGPQISRWQIVEAFRNGTDKGDFMAPYVASSHADQGTETGDYILQRGAYPYQVQYIRAVGGTTWHWAAAAWRFLPVDFRLRSTYGVGRDWPIGYDALESYYQQAEEEMGVSGPNPAEVDLGSPRSADYPMPMLPLSYMDREFTRTLNANGYRVAPEPVARNSTVFDGRPQCCGNNNCMPICPIAAQYSGNMHAIKAEAAGARLIPDATVVAIETDADGRMVTGARYRLPDGSEQRITAGTVILAANGIEIPKLMLMSRSDAVQNGLGNSSDMVGRNLMDHPGVSVSFLWDKPVFPGRGPQEMTSVVSLRDGPFRAHMAARKLHLGNTADLEGVTKSLIERGLRGPELDAEIRRRTSRKVAINCFLEQLPLPENRIVPSAEHVDALGVPKPEITYAIEEYVRAGAEAVIEDYQRIAGLLGGTEIALNRTFAGNNHIMGTTIMGDDPRDSVVDADCRCHDHPNLFVASSSVFASASTINSSLTIAALALRIADELLAG